MEPGALMAENHGIVRQRKKWWQAGKEVNPLRASGLMEGRRTYYWRIRVPTRRRDTGGDPRQTDQRGIVKPDGSCIYWDDGSSWERLDKQYDQDIQRTLPDPQRFTAHAQHCQLIPWLKYSLKLFGFAIIQEALDDAHIHLLRDAWRSRTEQVLAGAEAASRRNWDSTGDKRLFY